jgi:uncharacterized protein (TIGR04255 family)
MDKKQFPNPPLVEAVCEIRFDSNNPWDAALPGFLYQKIKSKFPERDTVREGYVEFSLNTKGGEKPEIAHSENELPRFLNSEKNVFVILRKNTLSIHNLKPYIGWKKFLPIIMSVIKAYNEVTKSSKIKRIGLRYVDKIIFENKKYIKLSEYFNFRPQFSEEIAQEEKIVAVQAGIIVNEGSGLVKIRLNNIAEKETDKIFLLDVDYFKEGDIQQAKIKTWLAKAHEKLEKIFLGSLTEKTIEKFTK